MVQSTTASQPALQLPAQARLPFSTKLLYGSGDWGMSSVGTIRQIFYAKFLTDVVGLEA